MAPNTSTLLAGLRRIFGYLYNRALITEEIFYMFRVQPAPRNSNFYFLEANKGCKPLDKLKSNAGDYQRMYFFVKDELPLVWNFALAGKSN